MNGKLFLIKNQKLKIFNINELSNEISFNKEEQTTSNKDFGKRLHLQNPDTSGKY
jgi:hypothetical protein